MLCSDAVESCTHLQWECSFAQAVWLQAPFWNSFKLPLHIQFVEVIDIAIHKLQTPNFEIFCVALWMIWNCRDKLILGVKELSHAGLWSRVVTYTLEFMEINNKNTAPVGPLVTRWSSPLMESSFN